MSFAFAAAPATPDHWAPHLAACESALIGHAQLDFLRDQFFQHWSILRGQDALKVSDQLLAYYADSRRGYHGLAHLADFVRKIDMYLLTNPIDEPNRSVLTVAAFFHNAVLETSPESREIDNTWESAILFSSLAAGIQHETAAEIRKLILVTRKHAPRSRLEDIFCDADLSILGAEPAAYARYENGLRFEQEWMPIEEYRLRREQVLQGYYARRPLFRTRFFRQLYEGQAVLNLEGALNKLESQPPRE